MTDAPANGQPLRQTALHASHKELGALMTGFGGWDMPLWYPSGAVKEHLAVVTAAGLFDTSHMDVFFVSGGNARALLDFAFTRDLSVLRPERALYGAFLDQNGYCLDDAVLYPLGDDRFAVVVNAGMAPILIRHLAALPQAKGVAVAEPEQRLVKLDVQGPAAPTVVGALLADPGLFASFPYFSFKGDFDLTRSTTFLDDGVPILLSRSGYTGEVGFEIFAPLDHAVRLWNRIREAGAPHGLIPCGLAARDSLRAGAVLPLSHQDIGAWPFINHPWQFALPMNKDGAGFAKAFVGSSALDPAAADHTLAFAGFDPRRVEAHEAKVYHGDREIGTVLTIVSDMAIGRIDGTIVGLSTPGRPADWKPRGLACGFVKVKEAFEPGQRLTLKDGRRAVEVEVVTDIRPNRSARKKLS